MTLHALLLHWYGQYARRAAAALVCVCALSAFLYGFFLLEAVWHAASQAKTADAAQGIKAQLSGLESQYLAATQALTPEEATAAGLVPPAQVAVVYAQDPARTLTFAAPLAPGPGQQ